jgi:hypothetical protein
MNIHTLADRLITYIGGFYGDGFKYFREDTESSHISQVIRETEVDFVPPEEQGEYHIPARRREFEGSARYKIVQWAGDSAETLIYHHGSGETNYGARIQKIAAGLSGPAKNIIAVSVPFNTTMKEYLYGVGSLARWTFMQASSVRLTEELTSWFREKGSPRIVCSGVSLGGFITNLHFSYYGTCDAYKPIFAGAAPDHLFTGTVYRRLLARPAMAAGERIREALNFEEDFSARDTTHVYSCMARFDQYIHFERQAGIYLGENMRILDRGHVTGAVSYRQLRYHLR